MAVVLALEGILVVDVDRHDADSYLVDMVLELVQETVDRQEYQDLYMVQEEEESFQELDLKQVVDSLDLAATLEVSEFQIQAPVVERRGMEPM
jgi:hypothetical protein